MLATFGRNAFRLRDTTGLRTGLRAGELRAVSRRGTRPATRTGWWRPWLDQIAEPDAGREAVSRVRVLTEPPTDYQRWEVWGARWNAEAGEQVSYMPRSGAERMGLALDHDWWLLDDERLIIMQYTDAGEIDTKELTTDPGTVAQYREWRDLAVRNAIPAEEYAAA